MAHWWRSTLAGFLGAELRASHACRLLSGGWDAGYLQLPGGAGPWGLVDGECNEWGRGRLRHLRNGRPHRLGCALAEDPKVECLLPRRLVLQGLTQAWRQSP